MRLAEDLQDETAEVLAKLIRFKTVNPPGNERECLEWLAGYLSDAGLRGASSTAPSPSGRTSWRNTRGAKPARSWATSPMWTPCWPTREDWTADPWGGEVRDGFLYGRGTIDMKNQTAAEAVAAANLARSGRALQGHAEGDRGRRRGDRRHARRQVDHREPPGPEPRRLPAQRGRGRADALRRPPALRRLRGREGHVPLQRRHHRHRRPRLGAGPGGERAAQARAA